MPSPPRTRAQPANARVRRLRSRRRGRRAGQHRSGHRGGPGGSFDDLHRALRLLRRRRNRRRLEARSAGCTPSCTANTSRSCTASPTTSSRASSAWTGSTTPHLTIQSQILARAYDISAFKIAADELLAEANVHVLFHAFAAGVVMSSDDRIDAVLVETKSGRVRSSRADLHRRLRRRRSARRGPECRTRIGDGAGNMLYPSTMFRINGVDPAKAGRAWDLVPKLMEEAEAARPHLSAQEADRSPAAQPHRMARQPHADQEPGRHGRQAASTRASCRTAKPKAAVNAGTCFSSSRNRRRASSRPTSSRSRRKSAFARDSPHTRRVRCSPRATSWAAAISTDTIGVQGWPVEAHIKGDVKFVFAPHESRGFSEIPYRIIVPQKVDNLLVAGTLRLDVARRSIVGARVGPLFHHGPSGGRPRPISPSKPDLAPRAIDVGNAAAAFARRGRKPRAFGSLIRQSQAI